MNVNYANIEEDEEQLENILEKTTSGKGNHYPKAQNLMTSNDIPKNKTFKHSGQCKVIYLASFYESFNYWNNERKMLKDLFLEFIVLWSCKQCLQIFIKDF